MEGGATERTPLALSIGLAELTLFVLLLEILSWTVNSLACIMAENHCDARDQAVVNKVADKLFASDVGPGLAVF